MRTLKLIVVAVALTGSTLAATPSWAKTAYQYWAQGQGVYVSSKEHPPELSEFFLGRPVQPLPPPPYGEYDGGYVPPPAPYGAPDY